MSDFNEDGYHSKNWTEDAPLVNPSEMTMRDYFAGQALVSIVTTSVVGGNANVDEMAVASYHIADAMLEARK